MYHYNDISILRIFWSATKNNVKSRFLRTTEIFYKVKVCSWSTQYRDLYVKLRFIIPRFHCISKGTHVFWCRGLDELAKIRAYFLLHILFFQIKISRITHEFMAWSHLSGDAGDERKNINFLTTMSLFKVLIYCLAMAGDGWWPCQQECN